MDTSTPMITATMSMTMTITNNLSSILVSSKMLNSPLKGRWNFSPNVWAHTPKHELYQLYLNVLDMMESRGYMLPDTVMSRAAERIANTTPQKWLDNVRLKDFEEYDEKYKYFSDFFT